LNGFTGTVQTSPSGTLPSSIQVFGNESFTLTNSATTASFAYSADTLTPFAPPGTYPITFFASGYINNTGNPINHTYHANLIVTSPTITSLTITPANPTVSVGVAGQLRASATFAQFGTSPYDVTSGVTWSSSNPAVATVSSTGYLTTLSAGQTTISATPPSSVGSITASSLVTVH
jgi:hypothetical protein